MQTELQVARRAEARIPIDPTEVIYYMDALDQNRIVMISEFGELLLFRPKQNSFERVCAVAGDGALTFVNYFVTRDRSMLCQRRDPAMRFFEFRGRKLQLNGFQAPCSHLVTSDCGRFVCLLGSAGRRGFLSEALVYHTKSKKILRRFAHSEAIQHNCFVYCSCFEKASVVLVTMKHLIVLDTKTGLILFMPYSFEYETTRILKVSVKDNAISILKDCSHGGLLLETIYRSTLSAGGEVAESKRSCVALLRPEIPRPNTAAADFSFALCTRQSRTLIVANETIFIFNTSEPLWELEQLIDDLDVTALIDYKGSYLVTVFNMLRSL